MSKDARIILAAEQRGILKRATARKRPAHIVSEKMRDNIRAELDRLASDFLAAQSELIESGGKLEQSEIQLLATIRKLRAAFTSATPQGHNLSTLAPPDAPTQG